MLCDALGIEAEFASSGTYNLATMTKSKQIHIPTVKSREIWLLYQVLDIKQKMPNQQFSDAEHAEIYSSHRPDIPAEIAEISVDFLKQKFVGALDLAVDVGCGSGQSSVVLSPFFSLVHAIDASEAQIQEARKNRAAANLIYSVQEAETLPFESGSVQLVTAGASLHWFDPKIFFKEVRRVLAPEGVFVTYTYHSLRPSLDCPRLSKEADLVYQTLYSYWPQEVHSSLEKYENICFPFEEVLRIPKIRQKFTGTFSDLIGFVESLSAFQIMKKKDKSKAENLIKVFRKRLEELLMTPNQPSSTAIKLYRDFYCILCRKD
ncbi:methyltransferase DDB_G0268948 [Caerostris extrusa]|uniref:Methyltransferase DDB_G0268948 n=1 Tax=Caerostris extrusa TaxID=172846 RepID=A0AAV4NFC8_CAEEX|nr:methyltransferase DDB_G0268948 [Caerostris extrusa]